MSTRNVPPEQWPEFLESFSRRHRAWLATVDQSGETIGRESAGQALLGSVTAMRDGRRVSAVEIAFVGDGHVPLRVENPTAIRVDQTREGAERGLEIVDDHGVCTRVGFRASATPEMLDGLAPGEV